MAIARFVTGNRLRERAERGRPQFHPKHVLLQAFDRGCEILPEAIFGQLGHFSLRVPGLRVAGVS
jgi:hypothetical protein